MSRAGQVPETVGSAARSNRPRHTASSSVTREYNLSIPGVLKNALDWVSRPIATNTIRDTPVAVIGASTGGFGGLGASRASQRHPRDDADSIAAGSGASSVVPVLARQAEHVNRVRPAVELHQHRRLVALDPAVVPRGDDHRRRRLVGLAAAVRVLDHHPSLHQEPDVRVHAQVAARHRRHVPVPAPAGWIDHPLDAAPPRLDLVNHQAADLAATGTFERLFQRTHSCDCRTPAGRSRRDSGAGRNGATVSDNDPAEVPRWMSIPKRPRSS